MSQGKAARDGRRGGGPPSAAPAATAKGVARAGTVVSWTLAGFATAAVTLGGCTAVAPTPLGASAAGLGATAARLPDSAAGFVRTASRPAAGRGDAEGLEVAYSTAGGPPTAAATVELLADGTAAPAALDAALAEALRPGPVRRMREAGRFTVAVRGKGAASAPPLFCAETEGRYGRERVAGLVCAGRASGALLRIRVTMPARQPPPGDARAFVEAVAVSLSGPASAAAAATRPG
ncbi:hypothetical protein [Craurococcus roseus]|uniref:hypothetical protein n=1 Tax=Craurococcus roseus TaxID=77585 RepID=UPI0031D6CABA